MPLTRHEEDYLKCLLHATRDDAGAMVGTNQVASDLGVAPASASGMLKKLRDKELLRFRRHGQWGLSERGRGVAVELFRRHRLWETFLATRLGFSEDEVHEVAEQLEHVDSALLIERLDALLGHPARDPHGEPIPNADGTWRS